MVKIMVVRSFGQITKKYPLFKVHKSVHKSNSLKSSGQGGMVTERAGCGLG